MSDIIHAQKKNLTQKCYTFIHHPDKKKLQSFFSNFVTEQLDFIVKNYMPAISDHLSCWGRERLNKYKWLNSELESHFEV